MGLTRKIWRAVAPNPLDRLLRKARARGQRRFLLFWNRGLGDLALGLYAINRRIVEFVPDASICYVTRPDLLDAFALLPGVRALADGAWQRGRAVDGAATLARLRLAATDFDVLIENPDPSYWVRWQLGTLTPRLCWPAVWDETREDARRRFALDDTPCVGLHVHSETVYGYEKNLPAATWLDVLRREPQRRFLLFGAQPAEGDGFADFPNVVDLRGRTSYVELMAIVRHHCHALICPDSGILSTCYFLDADFPLGIVSLWADARQGVLKQAVASPNPSLRHCPIVAPNGEIARIGAPEIVARLQSVLEE